MSGPDVVERQQQAMQRLLMAVTPGVLVLFWLYGWGVLINLLLAGTCAWAVEAGVRRLRGQGGGDLSGLVSAVLLALALALAFLLGNYALQYGATRLAAGTTALVMLSEVVFASVSSALLTAAPLEPRTLLGGSLIMLAALLAALQYRRSASA